MDFLLIKYRTLPKGNYGESIVEEKACRIRKKDQREIKLNMNVFIRMISVLVLFLSFKLYSYILCSA